MESKIRDIRDRSTTEMDIILNGQFTFEHKYVYDLLEGKGSLNIASVHLYDIDGDSKSDLMNIDAYQDYLVKSTSTTDDNLSILDSVSNTRITIENGNKDIVSIENEKGESIRFNNIKSDDIVSVFQGLGSVNYTKIVVSSRVETQYLKETYREFGKQYIATDEDVYSLSQGIKAENPEISLGRAYKLYIDAFGVVADYRVSDSIYDSIAAVVQFSMKKGMDHTLSAKLFTATGNFVNYDFANEYYIDGLPAIFNGETWMYNSKEVTETLKKEVFQFELNGKGEIRNVYLPSGEKQDGKISHTLGMLNVENILNDPNNYTMIYKRNGKHFIPYGSGTSYMNFIVLNAHAKVITIPSTTVVKNREAYFRVQEGELSNDYRAAAIGYSFSPDSTVSDLVVMISDGSSDLSSSSYYVVSDVYTCLNKEGAVVKGLSLMKNDGSVTEFYGEDEEIMECHPESGEKIRDNAEINVGDVIKIALNAAGEINAVGKFYDCNAGKGSMNNVTYWYTGNRFVYGCVYDIDTRSLAYVTGTSITPSMNFQTSLNLQGLLSAKAVMIKPGRNAEKIVEYGTIGEVVSYKENPELYSKMVLAGGYGEQSLLAFYLHE